MVETAGFEPAATAGFNRVLYRAELHLHGFRKQKWPLALRWDRSCNLIDSECFFAKQFLPIAQSAQLDHCPAGGPCRGTEWPQTSAPE